MARSLQHPDFGTLKYDLVSWAGMVELAGWGKAQWPDRLKLLLVGEEDGPQAGATPLVLSIMQRKDQLADVILEGLWTELIGGEPDGTCWWAGDLTAVNQALTSARNQPLQQASDLLRVLKPTTLFVDKDIHGDGRLVAGIRFRAVFEREHGLDVLTDAEKVTGTGYSGETEKYQRYSAISPDERRARHEAARAKVQALIDRHKRG